MSPPNIQKLSAAYRFLDVLFPTYKPVLPLPHTMLHNCVQMDDGANLAWLLQLAVSGFDKSLRLFAPI